MLNGTGPLVTRIGIEYMRKGVDVKRRCHVLWVVDYVEGALNGKLASAKDGWRGRNGRRHREHRGRRCESERCICVKRSVSRCVIWLVMHDVIRNVRLLAQKLSVSCLFGGCR